jgi:hypothetical protein
VIHRGDRGSARQRSLLLARRVKIGTVVLSVAAVLAFGPADAENALADTTDPDGQVNLTVNVTEDSSPSPTPTTTPRPTVPPVTPPRTPSTSSSTTNSSATSVATQATITDPVAADDALGADPVVVDGVLAMSGLSASASPSIAIGNGTLTVSFIVRNLSAAPFSSTATFWVDNAFGGLIAKTGEMAVDDLQPDETRRVQVVFEGLGQHIVLNVNATLTPPSEIAGTPIDPIGRNSTVMVPPWFSIALVSGIALFSRFGWWVYSPRGLGLRFGRLGT